jgi:hypothetical protein
LHLLATSQVRPGAAAGADGFHAAAEPAPAGQTAGRGE